MQLQNYLHDPSCADDVLVFRIGDRACALRDGRAVLIPHGAENVTSVEGCPFGPRVLIVADAAHACRTCIVDLRTGDILVEHIWPMPVRPVGWIDADRIVLTALIDGEPFGTSLHVFGEDGVFDTPLTCICRVDRGKGGQLVAVWGTVAPTVFAGYRGGGAGCILAEVDQSGMRRLPTMAQNPADLCALEDRLYFIDDPGDVCQVYSVPRNSPGETPRQHTEFAQVGVDSLRRGRDRLIIGRLGEIYELEPREGSLSHVGVYPIELTIVPARPGIERVRKNSGGDRIVLLAEGTLADDRGEPIGGAESFILDASWMNDETLVILERGPIGVQLKVHDFGTAEDALIDLPPMIRERRVDTVTAAGGRIVISGPEIGVWARGGLGSWSHLADATTSKRARPVLSADGVIAVWAQADDFTTSSIHAVSFEESAYGVMRVTGSVLRSPVFIDSDRFAFVSQPLDIVLGSLAPACERAVVAAVSCDDLVRQGQRAKVTILGRVAANTNELVQYDSRLWAVDGDHASLVDDVERALVEGDRFVGDEQTLAFSIGDGREVRCAGFVEPLHVSTRAIDYPEALAELLSVIDGYATAAVDDEVRSALEEAATRATHPSDFASIARAALRRLGRSHASFLSCPSAGDADSGRVTALRARGAEVVGAHAVYVALGDVGASAVKRVEQLVRGWTGALPLVLDLRFNQGGPYADYLSSLLLGLLRRGFSLSWRSRVGGGATAPERIAVLMGEATGSGGEQLAALLASDRRVRLFGRRSVGAGSGFHRRWRIAGSFVTVPQYEIAGDPARNGIENHGYDPDTHCIFRHDAGAAGDDALLETVSTALRSFSQGDRSSIPW